MLSVRYRSSQRIAARSNLGDPRSAQEWDATKTRVSFLQPSLSANGADAYIAAVIAQADAFLRGQTVSGVPGIKHVGPSGSHTLTAAQRALALDLKNTLNKYNSDLGCP